MAYEKTIELFNKIRNEELIERSKHHQQTVNVGSLQLLGSYGDIKSMVLRDAKDPQTYAEINNQIMIEERFQFPDSASKEYKQNHQSDVEQLRAVFEKEHQQLVDSLPDKLQQFDELTQQAMQDIKAIEDRYAKETEPLVNDLAKAQEAEQYVYYDRNDLLDYTMASGVSAYVKSADILSANGTKPAFTVALPKFSQLMNHTTQYIRQQLSKGVA